jgi:hypothetical protein
MSKAANTIMKVQTISFYSMPEGNPQNLEQIFYTTSPASVELT